MDCRIWYYHRYLQSDFFLEKHSWFLCNSFLYWNIAKQKQKFIFTADDSIVKTDITICCCYTFPRYCQLFRQFFQKKLWAAWWTKFISIYMQHSDKKINLIMVDSCMQPIPSELKPSLFRIMAFFKETGGEGMDIYYYI